MTITEKLDRGMWCAYAGHYVASASEYRDEETGRVKYVISYHDGDMPAFNSETFGSVAAIIAAMREVQPDLRKWKKTAE